MGGLPGPTNKKALWTQTFPEGFRSPNPLGLNISYRFPTSIMPRGRSNYLIEPHLSPERSETSYQPSAYYLLPPACCLPPVASWPPTPAFKAASASEKRHCRLGNQRSNRCLLVSSLSPPAERAATAYQRRSGNGTLLLVLIYRVTSCLSSNATISSLSLSPVKWFLTKICQNPPPARAGMNGIL